MTINLEHLRVGDTITFADGTQGICTVSYSNGGRFVRWAVPGKDWSESDAHCCSVSIAFDGKRGFTESSGRYRQHPKDIVNIGKPPLHELQDELENLREIVKRYESKGGQS